MLVLLTIRWLACKKDSIEKVSRSWSVGSLNLNLPRENVFKMARNSVNNRYFTLPYLHLHSVNKSLSIPWKIAASCENSPLFENTSKNSTIHSLHSSRFGTRKPVSFLFLFLFLFSIRWSKRNGPASLALAHTYESTVAPLLSPPSARATTRAHT